MSYLEFYGLKKEPFSNAPVSQFYFNSTPHSQALTRLAHAVSQSKGLAVLMGEAGAGKTTLARRLLDSLPESEYEATLLVIIHSGITTDWLLKRIAVQLGIEKPASEKLSLLGQLYQRLLTLHEEGKKAVVLIDEAQMLQTREIMEEFRGLLNLELPERKLLTFVLFGLPEVEQYLKLDPPLHQRVALKIRLSPLSGESTEAYIKHRLKLSGATRMPFSAEAVQAIHRFSEGTPRIINTICDNCLFEAFLAKQSLVSQKLVQRVANELGITPSLHAAPPPPVAPEPPPAAPVAGRIGPPRSKAPSNPRNPVAWPAAAAEAMRPAAPPPPPPVPEPARIVSPQDALDELEKLNQFLTGTDEA
jgi:type II secretory pathway predicted ATPase ExeA